MRKDGSVFPAKLVSNPIYDTEKLYIGAVTVCEDISTRKQAEEELRQYHRHLEALVDERTADLSAAINQANQLNEQLQHEIVERTQVERELRVPLQEKEVLLKEVHHRVKNNLQIISSLLNLQANSLTDDPARRMFTASQHRIRALGLIHEKLYQSDDITHIDFNEYLKTLVAELQAAYRDRFRNLQLTIRVMDVNLTLDTAIPCGLILNELVSNAMKYAFPNRDGVLTIAMRRKPDQTYEFVVSDNGVGIPPDCDPYHPQSLGLQLVKGLVEEQLEGSLELNPRRGVTWKIRFR